MIPAPGSMFPVPKTSSKKDWQASASFAVIKLRAQTLRHIRSFFYDKGVLEVDTPVLSSSSVPDPFIESFQTQYVPLTQCIDNNHYYLHTSPEFPMKRLLASGSGSIYQIAKVFRQGEISTRHNPEFSLLEWYRVGWDHQQLMREVNVLLSELLKPFIELAEPLFISYAELFQKEFSFNPHSVSKAELIRCVEQLGLANVLTDDEDKDRYLDLLFSHKIEPYLGSKQTKETGQKAFICFVYHYPASQASLAKISMLDGHPVAERFEVFINGMELANGFHELNDAREQQARFAMDNKNRNSAGQQEIPLDQRFLNSLNYLPQCAGVALGIDRLLMLMSQAKHINEVIAFPFNRA